MTAVMKHGCLGVLIAIAGCATDEPNLGHTEQADFIRCPKQSCNSPELAHYGLWEQNLFGQPDSNGIWIRSLNGVSQIIQQGVSYNLVVKNGRISGIKSGSPTLRGDLLVGARIELMAPEGRYFDITITRVRTSGTAFFAGEPGEIETYTMVWHEPGTSHMTGKYLCNSPLQPTEDAKTYELLGMLPEETLVYEGDRYSIERMTTGPTGDNAWFNFGCAGHTLAKLYLTRNTIKTQPVDDWAQRQTTLKMLVGDYCGTGETFTLAGEPLLWKGGLQPSYSGTPLSIDARWTEDGATCMVEPRIKDSTNAQAQTLFPDVETQIQTACAKVDHRIVTCDNVDIEDLDGTRVISANR